MFKFLHAFLDGPEPTQHQAQRLRMLCKRMADRGGNADDAEVYRDLQDALKLGLRKGLFYAIDAQETVGLTARGYRYIGRN